MFCPQTRISETPQGMEELVRAQVQKEIEPFARHLGKLHNELEEAFEGFLSRVNKQCVQVEGIASVTGEHEGLRPSTKLEIASENLEFKVGTEKHIPCWASLAIATPKENLLPPSCSPRATREKSTSTAAISCDDLRSENKAEALREVLHANGLAEFTSAFVKENICDLETAAILSLEEVRAVLNSHSKPPSVGLVRNCYRVLSGTRWNHAQELQKSIAPTPQSVLARSLLHLSPIELKNALNSRINAETIFASLMLAIAATALMDTPLEKTCDLEYGVESCDGLRCAYLFVWGIASAMFVMACLVSLGSMQIMFGGACSSDVHARYIGGETYFHLAHNFISVALIYGLLPGLCLNMFLRFPKFWWACAILSVFTWMLWLVQLIRGMHCIWNIYGDFPGFNSMLQFFMGYIAVGKIIELHPGVEQDMKKLVRRSVASKHQDESQVGPQLMSFAFGRFNA